MEEDSGGVLPEHQSHLGDNIFSDIRQARRNGLVASHFGESELNRYEKRLAAEGGDR